MMHLLRLVIIDAICLGKFRNGVLLDDNFGNINNTYGHGIHYYSMPTHGFDEMIANYGSIIKSKNGPEILQYLRTIVGDEVVDMIAKTDEEKIINSPLFLNEKSLMEEASNVR